MLVERKEFKNDDQSIGYIESIFESGNLLKSIYFPESRKLYLTFSRGHTYLYGDISPEFYQEFENSDSQGKFFYNRISKNPNIKFRREFNLFPSEIQEIKEIIESKRTIQIIEEDDDE